MAQDFNDILQPFDFLVDLLDDNKASLGIRYIAQHDEDLVPEFPAILVQTDNTEREYHATQMFLVRFHMDIWVFHAELSSSKAVRSRKDIELATAIRKLIHTDRTMQGHILQSWVDGEFPGISVRVIEANPTTMVTTRLTWQGENRVRFQDS
jgi:hypothetical protein